MADSIRDQQAGRDERAGVGDTIVALATPEGEGGLAVVRLSGPGAVAVVRALLTAGSAAREIVSHRAWRAVLRWPGEAGTRMAGGRAAPCAEAAGGPPGGEPRPGEPLDEAIVLPLLGPHSYTGEDTVELQCHGGRLTARRLVGACVAAGARPAAPGEFTRRAFLNGRLSLDQAEAVADLIHAEDELTARAALRQLRGGLRDELASLEASLRALLAELEGRLEFSADDPSGCEPVAAEPHLAAAAARLDALLAAAPAARRLREGVQVVLVGPPNVGKSSLFNALLGQERAIVDPEPGTTRDVVEAVLSHAGCRFVLHDTAGLRAGAGRVESLGQGRARAAMARADIVLCLRAAGSERGPEPAWQPELPPGAVALSVVTKGDLASAGESGAGESDAAPLGGVAPAAAAHARDGALITSARTGFGVVALRHALAAAADQAKLREVAAQGWLLNERHRHALLSARRELEEVRDACRADAGEEIVATLLAGALARLGEVSGRVFTERLLDEVFGRFCVGK